MDDNDFDSTLQKLSQQIDQLSKANPVNGFALGNANSGVQNSSGNSGFFSGANTRLLYYAAIPVAIFIILMVWKPGFVTEEILLDDMTTDRKVSIKRALIASAVITTILGAIFFFRSYRKGQENKGD